MESRKLLQQITFTVVLATISFAGANKLNSGFTVVANGQVANASLIFEVAKTLQCATFCHHKIVCSMFSLTTEIAANGTKRRVCRVAYGFKAWTPHPSSKLYIGI